MTPDEKIQRLLPRSDEAESSLLSTWLSDPATVGGLCMASNVTEDWFMDAFRQGVFKAIKTLWTKGELCVWASIAELLRADGMFDDNSGQEFYELERACPIPSASQRMIDILREKASQRALIGACQRNEALAWDETDVPSLLAKAMKDVSDAANIGTVRVTKKFHEHVHDYARSLIEADGVDDTLKTGIEKLDRMSPLRRGDMPIIAGERKAGKSILSLTIALRLAEKWPVIYFSLEDKIPKLMRRFVANASKVPANCHRQPSTAQDMQMAAGMSRLQKMNLILHDDLFDLHSIVGATRQAKAQHPSLVVAVIDYAQLVRGVRAKGDTRESEVANTSRTLRLLGMELNIAILLLSQLNKDGDTRESKALEQDTTAMWKLALVEDEPLIRTLEIPFQRDGDSGIGFRVAFLGDRATVETLYEGE